MPLLTKTYGLHGTYSMYVPPSTLTYYRTTVTTVVVPTVELPLRLESSNGQGRWRSPLVIHINHDPCSSSLLVSYHSACK